MGAAGGSGGGWPRGAARTDGTGSRVLWIVVAAVVVAAVVREVVRRRAHRPDAPAGVVPPPAVPPPAVPPPAVPAAVRAGTGGVGGVEDVGARPGAVEVGVPAGGSPSPEPVPAGAAAPGRSGAEVAAWSPGAGGPVVAPQAAGPAGPSTRVGPVVHGSAAAVDDTPTPPLGIPVGRAGTGGAPTGPARLPARPSLATDAATDPRLRAVPFGVGAVAAVRAPVLQPRRGLDPAPEPAAPAHRWGLGAYLLAQAVFLLVSLVIGLTLFDSGPLSTGVLAVAVAVPGLVVAAVAVVITLVRGNGPFVDLRLRWSWRELGIGLAFGFGGLFVSLPASAVYVAVVGEDASSAVGDIFAGFTATPAEALLIAALVVLVVPVCEEVLFRGLLWGGLTRLGANVWVAFGVTTVIFALAHFEWPRAILLLVVALPIGLARIYGGGLLAPIVAHQVNNLLPGVGLYLMLTGAFPAL